MAKQPPTDDVSSPDDGAAETKRTVLSACIAWLATHRLKAATIGSGAAITIGAAVTLAMSLARSESEDRAITLEMALQALDDGRFVQAETLAEDLSSRETIPSDQLGGPAFVLGAAAALEANENWSRDKKGAFLLASRYLEEARDRGFPEGRRPQGLYLLGVSLYESGQYAASRPHLRDAARLDPNRQSEIDRLLAGAYLYDANPRYEDALRHNQLYLTDRTLSPPERGRALVLQCQILFGLGRTDECNSVLDAIPVEAASGSEAVLMRGRLLLHEARAMREAVPEPTIEVAEPGDKLKALLAKYGEAVEKFREAQGRDTIGTTATHKAMYLTGVCYFEMAPYARQYYKRSMERLQMTRKRYPDTPESQAASLLEGDLLRRLDRPAEAVVAYRRTMASVTDPQVYSNPWLSLDEFRRRIMTAYRDFVERQQFEEAMEVLDGFTPLFDKTRTIQLRATTANLWGVSLLEQARGLAEEEALPMRRLARKQFRRAGYMYAKLAKIRIATREYPDDLWNSAENYLRGNDFTSSRAVFGEYLKNETRRRRPLALVNLGKAHLALREADKAVAVLRECINDFPRDAAIYEARLWCSKAYIELVEYDKAEALLAANLTADDLTPASPEWRESLFDLGQLLHDHGRMLHERGEEENAAKKQENSIEKLEEAVQRYPDVPQVTEALYTIAEANRLAAQDPIKKYEESTIESARRSHLQNARQFLSQALDYYRQLQRKLNRRQEEVELTKLEHAILRNCYMSIGATLSDLGRYENPRRYEEAIEAYGDASTRYQNEPIVLEAYLRIANCYRRLGKPYEARGTLKQAKVVLERLEPDEPFELTTNQSRQQWERLLTQFSTR